MNADLLEITWSTIAAIGLSVSLVGIHSAQMQVWSARRSGTNGARMMVARAVRRRESLRSVVQLMYLLAGAGAMLRPPTPVPTRGRALIIIMLMGGSLVTVVNSMLDRRDATALRRYLDTHPSPAHGTPVVEPT